MSHFQCPECGFGDYEVGHLVACTEIYGVVCLGEQGRKIRVERWEEGGGLRPACANACWPPVPRRAQRPPCRP